jgi:hypothetical protein
MNIKNILSEGASHHSKLSQVTRGLVAKWEKTGLLEGMENNFERSGVATLLENQARQLVKEASATGTDSNSEEWAGVALPLVRRIFSEIAAKDFVSVQPMNLPSGLVFYLDFKYGTGQPGFTTGSGRTSQADSVFGVTDTSVDPSGGLYGAGRFGYSINEDFTQALVTGSSVSATEFTTGSVSLSDVNYDTSFTSSYGQFINNQQMFKLTVGTASMTRPDLKGIRGFRVIAQNNASLVDQFPQFTKLTTDGHIQFIVSGSLGTPTNKFKIAYQVQPNDTNRGDFEQTTAGFDARPETDLEIPELNVEMKSEAIVAKTRKLKAQWTPEFAQDLNAYHSIDAEAELTSMLSEYISQEIDLEILDMLIQDAKTEGFWSATIGRQWNGSSFGDYTDVQAAAASFTQMNWYQTLGTVIANVSNKIHQKTLRGGANFLVVSPEVATIIESIPGYASDSGGDQTQFAFGVTKVGALNSRYQVYKNPYMKENLILMGYRGNQFLETGAVYSPYIPLIMTPLVYDPKSFTPRKGVMTRYAKKMLRGEFYGKIFVDGLHTLV